MILHLSQIFLMLGRTFMGAVVVGDGLKREGAPSEMLRDQTAMRVAARKLHFYAPSTNQANDCMPESGGRRRAHRPPVVEAHAVHRVR
jgi:hypothetical protein